MSPETRGPVVLLAQDCESTRAVYHALAREFSDVRVVLEQPVPRSQIIRRRVKRQGLQAVIGQILFVAAVVPLLRYRGRRRIEAIRRHFELEDGPIGGLVKHVPSVNSDQALEVLRTLDPSAVVINGTRIISNDTLATVDAPFINMHAGITPLYRGVHGGYWALAEGRPDLVGTTIHLVDSGIDTGQVIEQIFFSINGEDSFATYPYLHAGNGMPCLINAVRWAVEGKLEPTPEPQETESKLRYHPTLWGYLIARLRRGVK